MAYLEAWNAAQAAAHIMYLGKVTLHGNPPAGYNDGDLVGFGFYFLGEEKAVIYRPVQDATSQRIRLRLWRGPGADFDSGWFNIAQGQTLTITHNLGGLAGDYFVYLEYGEGHYPGNSHLGGEHDSIDRRIGAY